MIVVPAIPGLEIVEVLGEGSSSTVFKARSGGQSFALKLLKPEIVAQHPTWAQSACRRAALATRLDHPGLPRVLSTGEVDGVPYFVTSLAEGETLASRLRNGPLAEAQLVDLARGLASALAELHAHGLVHRDVKPENVILGPGGPIIVDLDLIETGLETVSRTAAGTLLYAAPELTGTVQRPVDHRSDLYALGALLFECATGQPPFAALTPAELAREHALTPPPQANALNPKVSAGLSAIIGKLLAKGPEDRYQSAAGLLFDLDLLPTLEVLAQEGRQFDLGARDSEPSAERPDVPSPARPRELQRLRDVWNAAVEGTGGIVVVAGPGGSGKTVLSGKLAAEVAAQHRLALTGKLRDEASSPFEILRIAVENWLAGLRVQPLSRRERDEERIRIAAQDSAPILGVLWPEIAALCKSEPIRPEAMTSERFADIVAQFLVRLADSHGGMLLFLDDADRSDHSTQVVVERLVHEIPRAPILLLATVRAATRTAAHLRGYTEKLGSTDREILWLGRLRPPSVNVVVADELGGHNVDASAYGHIDRWTNGNPLAIKEYTRALLEDGVLRLEWGTWTLDMERLRHAPLPTNAAQLIERRVNKLDETSREILQLGAIIGAELDPALLEAARGHSPAVGVALAAASSAGLIRPNEAGQYAFSHERIREELISRLSAVEMAAGHLQIAQALDRLGEESDHLALSESARKRAPDNERTAFMLARHYALAGAMADPERVYETNKAAGAIAMDRYANSEAYEFFTAAVRAGAVFNVRARADADMERGLGTVCALTGRWAEALPHLQAALEATLDRLERANLHGQIARVHLANRETDQAWNELQRAFREVGTPFGRSALARALYTLWSLLAGLLSLRFRVGYGTVRGRWRRRLEVLSDLHLISGPISYLQHDWLRFVELVIRQLYLGHLLGDSIPLATAYMGYANLLAVMGRRDAARKYGEKSVQLAQKLGDRFQLARMRMFRAWQAHMGGEPHLAEQLMRECLRLDATWLDATDYTFAHTDLLWNLMMRGYCREALTIAQSALERAHPASGERFNLEVRSLPLLAILGQQTEAVSKLPALERQAAGAASTWQRQTYLDHLLPLRYEQGEYAMAAELLDEYHALAPSPRVAQPHTKHFYVFEAYLRLAQAEANRDDPHCRKELRRSLTQLRRAGPHPTLRCHCLLLTGALHRLERRRAKATNFIQAAQALAYEGDNPWAIFEAHRQMAHCLSERHHQEAAMREARLAHRLAVEFGWVGRARRLRGEFDALRGLSGQQPEQVGISAGVAPQVQPYIDALLQVSAAASSSLDPLEQSRFALDEVIQLLKAERGFLFYCLPDGELLLRAARTADRQDLDHVSPYSRSVVEMVRTSCEPVTLTGSDSGEVLASDSIVAQQLRSIIAAPLLVRGRLLGVIYVDSRIDREILGQGQLKVLTAIASQIATAFDATAMIAEQRALARTNADLLDALRLRIADLQQSRERMVAAEERLRREVAEMLHGRVQSRLHVAVERLHQARERAAEAPAQAQAMIQQVEEQLKEMSDRDIRQASHLLHPSFIRRGLVLALESLVSRFEDTLAVAIEVDPAVSELDTVVGNQLPEPVRLAAYRGIEEALANAQRHAQASSAAIRLSLTDRQELEVEVRDDGRGFDSASVEPGLGLSSVGGRANQLGGTWQIDSRPGAGTRLVLTLPLGVPKPAAG